MFTLKVFRGDRLVQELDLDGPEVKIGRSPDNPVVLADDGKGVSRVHAIIREEDGHYVLYDSNSRNGTHVDGKAIKRMVIHPGQDFVVGPYRLRFGSAELSGSMPTVVVPRDAAAVESPQEGTAGGRGRDGTAGGGVVGQTKSKSSEGSTKGRTVGGSTKGPTPAVKQKQGMPAAYVAAAAVGVLAVGALVLWLLWPQSEEPVQVVEALPVTTTSIPEATTTIPEAPPPDPYAEPMAQATLAMEAAEATFAQKRYVTAEREFNRILKEHTAPILALDAAYAPALELAERARSRSEEARTLRAAAEPPKPTGPVAGPDDLPVQPGESTTDWQRRNTEARQDYDLGKRYFDEGNNLSALKLFADLAAREPGWRDVSAYVKNAQERLDRERLEAVNDALRLEGAGHKSYLAKNFEAAARELTAARKAFDRAVALEAPGVEKHLADNLERRRAVGKLSLDLARTHANRKNRPEARKWYQLVIDLLPSGDPVRAAAETEITRVGP